jgi:serine/threonine protein kinase/tetratricopeptide (TPR) repeat protein
MREDSHHEDRPSAGNEPIRDPWLHFTITAESVSAQLELQHKLAESLDGHGTAEGEGWRSPTVSGSWTSDPGDDLDAASLVAEDLFRRRRRGDTASFSVGSAPRRPAGDSIGALVSCKSFPGSVAGTSGRERILRLPEVGDTLFGFHLRYPLGRGAFARVFLAEQSDLAGRPVVLKVSAIEGTEPQTLAQLQHTNIVPIYSAHEDPRAGLRAVCMPYFGGASLASLLQQCWSGNSVPQRGADFVAALEAVQSPPPGSFKNGVEISVGGLTSLAGEAAEQAATALAERNAAQACTPLTRLRNWNYIQATAWILAEIAEGLQHAHQRGIFHRDIKPSNILISSEGQPLLLDFNLAQDQDIDPALATLGGTVAYMAPEHLRALAGRSSDLIRQVDERSDIYSLGMVLAEMLTGQSPFDQSASYSALPLQIEAMAVERSRSLPSVRQQRTEIPWGIESIVRKCLTPDPALRYQQADHLAEDLRRFLDDRPLAFAPELSRVEQVRKFARRHPRLTSSSTVAAAAAIILLAGGWVLSGVHDRLGAAQAHDRLRAHERGTTEALCLINTVLDLENQSHLRQGVEVCERTLGLYKVPGGTIGKDLPDLAFLSPSERLKLLEDRRELLLLLAGARIRLAPNNREARRQALLLLDQAEASTGLPPSRAVWLERGDNLERLGEPVQAAAARRTAEQIPATTARDHYALATTYARRGGTENLRRALLGLDEALRMNPRHYWSAVQRGICHFELGEHLLAAADFGQCIGLWPESAWGYFNRGCVLERDGRTTEAISDYTAALQHDADFAPATINRGWALLKLKRHAEALVDFDRALARGRRDGMLHAGRGIALEGLKRHAEADLAFAAEFARAAPRPDQARARLCWLYGFAVAERLPEKARIAFDDVLLQDPRHPEALYGRAMLAAAAGRSEQGIAALNRALAARPGFNEARRARAVLLARKSDWEQAGQDINWCLEREPTSGDTLYAAACVAAIAADASPSPRAVGQALDLLRRALECGVPPARAAADSDLAAIQRDPRFETLLARSAVPEHRKTREPIVR